jgi:hypothetical protein
VGAAVGTVGDIVGLHDSSVLEGPRVGVAVIEVGDCDGRVGLALGIVGDLLGLAEGGVTVGARVGADVLTVGDVEGDNVVPTCRCHGRCVRRTRWCPRRTLRWPLRW